MTIRRFKQAEPARVLAPGQVVYVVRRRLWPWLLVLLASLTLILIIVGRQEKSLGSSWPLIQESQLFGEGEEKIAIINLDGVIEDGGGERQGSRRSPVWDFSAALRKARDDQKVKAIVVSVNSPGGGITASDIMWRQLEEFKGSGKPVVALLGDLAASGGYYVIAPCDLIIAHPTTITGSIGVIMMNFNIEGLMAKIGIKDVTIKAGKHKDLFSPFREMTPEERESIQRMANGMLNRFIRIVAQGRGLKESEVRGFADGSIFSADEALELGLIDRIGYLEDAVAAARELSEIEQSLVVEYGPPPTLLSMVGVTALGTERKVEKILDSISSFSGPKMMYLWNP